MTVTLTPEQEKFVAEQLESGNFDSVDQLVAHSLMMLQAQEDFIRANSSELREKIAASMEQIRRGEVVDGKITTLFRQMKKDQVEIEKLKAETRTMLAEMKTPEEI
jgi:antitoxin ParD1/3/4